jgi:hypothetical protein
MVAGPHTEHGWSCSSDKLNPLSFPKWTCALIKGVFHYFLESHIKFIPLHSLASLNTNSVLYLLTIHTLRCVRT